MAIVKAAQQWEQNLFGATNMFLNDLAIPGVGPRFILFWGSRSVYNTGGYILKVLVRDGGEGGTEYNLTMIAATPDPFNPKLYLWYAEVPDLLPSSDMLVQFSGSSDRRWVFGGYNLDGVDIPSIPAPVYASDQTGTGKEASVVVPAGPKTGEIFCMPGGLRSGFGVKPDYLPLTPDLVEDYDSPIWSGSEFYGSAAGSKPVTLLVPTEVRWQLSPDFDTFWTIMAIWLPSIFIPPPPAPTRVQALSVEMQKVRTLEIEEAS